MQTATCKHCGKEKPYSEFDKIIREAPLASWNLRRCKECTHAEYLRRYAHPGKRATQLAASQNWKKANPEKHAALAREYRNKHPEKIVAQNRLNYAIKKGVVTRQPCEACGTSDRVHAHHASYEPKDWYNVRWLCYVCHKLEHHSKIKES